MQDSQEDRPNLMADRMFHVKNENLSTGIYQMCY